MAKISPWRRGLQQNKNRLKEIPGCALWFRMIVAVFDACAHFDKQDCFFHICFTIFLSRAIILSSSKRLQLDLDIYNLAYTWRHNFHILIFTLIFIYKTTVQKCRIFIRHLSWLWLINKKLHINWYQLYRVMFIWTYVIWT